MSEATPVDPERAIAFQGVPGAYSHLACRQAYPELIALPCHSFEDAFAAVRDGSARYAMIAVDNPMMAATGHRIAPPATTEYGLVEFALVDPDGNLVRVGSPLSA